MQSMNIKGTKLGTLAIIALAFSVGCGAAAPPKELLEARSTYDRVSKGIAAEQSPAQLHVAKDALASAEKSLTNDGDSPDTRDLAYVAMRKAQLAEAMGGMLAASKERDAADKENNRLTGEALKRAQGELSSTKNALANEKAAREAAEKKAAQAMADLQKIAAVKQETRGMVITLSGGVLFASGESTLLPAAILKLNEVAEALTKSNPDSSITVEGHTDSQGSRDTNMALSLKRADAVRDQLVARGVAADRIKSAGLGPDRPIADNKSPEGRANNRRVEIVVK